MLKKYASEMSSAGPDNMSMTPPSTPSEDDATLLAAFDEEMLFLQQPPPVSHATSSIEDEPEVEKTVCFQCQGKASLRATHKLSYMHSGVLHRLLNGFPVSDGTPDDSAVELLGYLYNASSALWQDIDILFYSLRQTMEKVKCQGSFDTRYSQVRPDCRKVWDFIKLYLTCWLPDDVYDTEQVLNGLLLHCKDILFQVGCLKDLPSGILDAAPSAIYSNQSDDIYHEQLHLHLDTYWALIEVFHLLSSHDVCLRLYDASDAEENNVPLDPFSQLTHHILSDIVSLAVNRYNNLCMNELSRESPFSCSCVVELVIMMIQLLEHRQTKMAKPSFWVTLNPILMDIMNSAQRQKAKKVPQDSDVMTTGVSSECRDALGCCWWLLLHISQLYQYDCSGLLILNKSVQENYYMVEVLLKKTLSGPPVGEAALRTYLKSLLSITSHWSPSLNIVAHLSDYFFKRLNDHFALFSAGIMGYTIKPKTPRNLLELCYPSNVAQRNIEGDTSYQLFLRILVQHLGSSDQNVPTPEWHKAKGRFYIKFSNRRVQDLSEKGLQNFACLFLTLAASTDLHDVSNKLYELLSGLELSGVDMTRRLIMWKTMFALMLLHIQRDTDIGYLADHMCKCLHDLTSKITQADGSLYIELWRLVHVYIEGTLDIVESSSQLMLNEHKLIGAPFRDLIKTSRENELQVLLNFVLALITKNRAVYKRLARSMGHVSSVQHRGLSDSLWLYMYGFVQEHACTETPPLLLADVAAAFTLLSLQLPPSVNTGLRDSFALTFQYFAWGENINALISCRYLCHLLPSSMLSEQVKQEIPDAELCLIQAWFRCSLLILPSHTQLQELTRLIMKLDEMRKLLDTSDINNRPNLPVVRFIKALASQYSQLQGLQDKLQFQKFIMQILGDVGRHIAPVIKTWAPLEQLCIMYNITGRLVKHCAGCLYVKSRPDCLLPLLIERLVLPRVLLSDKPLPHNFLPALKDNLHLFLQGLGSLDYNRDPYIQRKIRDIIIHYLPRFHQKSLQYNSSAVHPIVTAMNASCRKETTSSAVVFRQHVLKVIVSEYLTLKGTVAHPKANIAWDVIQILLTQTVDSSVKTKDISILLHICLDFQLLCDHAGIKNQVLNVTQHLIEALDNHPVFWEESQKILESFINEHVKVFEGKALKVLDIVAVFCPCLLENMIPCLIKAVKDSEIKTGVGINKNLRFSLIQLLEPLGAKGQAVKAQLLHDAL